MIVFTVKIELLSNVTTSCSVKCKSRWKVKWLGHTPCRWSKNKSAITTSWAYWPSNPPPPPYKKRKKKHQTKTTCTKLKVSSAKKTRKFYVTIHLYIYMSVIIELFTRVCILVLWMVLFTKRYKTLNKLNICTLLSKMYGIILFVCITFVCSSLSTRAE